MVLLYEKYLLHLTLTCPDDEWNKISSERQEAYGKDLVARVNDLQERIMTATQPVIDEFFARLPEVETAHFAWHSIDSKGDKQN